MTKTVSRTLIKRLALLSCVTEPYLDELLAHCYLKSVSAGGVVLRKKEQDRVHCYLIEGQIGVWHSFNERTFLDHSSVQCQQPLNDLLLSGSVIRAVSPCRVLRVNSNILGQLLAQSTAGGAASQCRSGPDYFDKAMAAIFNTLSALTGQNAGAPPTPTAAAPLPAEDSADDLPAAPERQADRPVNPLKIVAR